MDPGQGSPPLTRRGVLGKPPRPSIPLITGGSVPVSRAVPGRLGGVGMRGSEVAWPAEVVGRGLGSC